MTDQQTLTTTDEAAGASAAPPKRKERIASLDAFRGFTILGMVFVIAVAAGGYMNAPGSFNYGEEYPYSERGLPQKWPYFNGGDESMLLSTWFHAEVAWDRWHHQAMEGALEDAGMTRAEFEAMEPEAERAWERQHLSSHPNWPWKNIGVTFTDFIAPWFVFIVGVCIPLSRRKRGAEFWKHAISRTLMLIIAGVLYMSFVLRQIAPFWGVLQAIGVAYFCGVMLTLVPRGPGRWVVIFVVAGLNLLLALLWPSWTMNTHWFPDMQGSWFDIARQGRWFWTLADPTGSEKRLMTVHCLPWLSISYGVMTMIGVLLGEVIKEGRDEIIKRAVLLAGIFIPLGLAIHYYGVGSGNWPLCMSKPDVTTSYAFFTAGAGALAYLLFYLVMDVWKIQGWAQPLLVFGVNPLLAYFMMILMRRWLMDPLGLTGFFNMVDRAEPDLGNPTVFHWVTWLEGAFGEGAANAALIVLDKSMWSGMFWGLLWTFLLWLIVRWCNRRNIYWKL